MKTEFQLDPSIGSGVRERRIDDARDRAHAGLEIVVENDRARRRPALAGEREPQRQDVGRIPKPGLDAA